MSNRLRPCWNICSTGLKKLAMLGIALGIFGAVPVSAVDVQVLVVNDEEQDNSSEPPPCNGEPNYHTIQEAINAAGPGALITICPGTFEEDLTILGKDDLTLHCVNVKDSPAVIEGQATNNEGDFPLASPNINIQADMITIANCTITVPGGVGRYGSGIVIGGKNNAITENHIICEAGDPGTVCLQTWNSAALENVPSDISGSLFGLNDWTCESSGGAFGCEGLFINPQYDDEDFMSIVHNEFSGQFYRLIAVARPKVTVANNVGTTDKSPTDENEDVFGRVPVGIKLFGAGDSFGTRGGSNKANTTDSLVLENRLTSSPSGQFARGIWVEGRGEDGSATANLLKKNIARGASDLDCWDQTTGHLTADTANLWAENFGDTDDPDGICEENEPPDCSSASASPSSLWPPNHKFVSIGVVGVTDPDGDTVTITIDSIFQDEAVDAKGSGHTAPDGSGVGEADAKVRAERSGRGNGRVYHIGFTADDGNGGSCAGEVTVGVPHDRRGSAPVDEGALYDSTFIP